MVAVDAPASSDVAILWREAEGLRWKLALSAWHLAERESRRIVMTELTRADLANEAAVGLYDAAIRFDPERGFLFRTYARWWIRAQTKNAVGDAHLIVRLPDSARRRRARLMRARPDDTPLSPTRKASAAHLRSSFASVAWQNVPADGGLPLEETTSDPTAPRVDDEMERTEELALATQVLFDSDAGVHRDILLDRFGLRGREPQTLRQLGSRIGITAERVRQLECEGLRTLRDCINRVNAVTTIGPAEDEETRSRRLPRAVWRPRGSSRRARAT
jgi:RNA polymerase nonessential primary-like sigma factor